MKKLHAVAYSLVSYVRLHTQEAHLSVMDAEYKKYLDWNFSLIKNLPKGFEKADLEQKQKIVGSIFPERLIFEKNQFRTKKMNRVIQLISQNTNEKTKNKKDLALTLSAKSDKVELLGNVSNHFCDDLVDTYLRIIHKK